MSDYTQDIDTHIILGAGVGVHIAFDHLARDLALAQKPLVKEKSEKQWKCAAIRAKIAASA